MVPMQQAGVSRRLKVTSSLFKHHTCLAFLPSTRLMRRLLWEGIVAASGLHKPVRHCP
jgi:hypothetical protein